MVDPAWFGLIDFKVLLLEKLGGAPKAWGKQVNQTTLCARATRGLGRTRRGSLTVLLLAERAHSEGARSTRAFEDRPGRPLRRKGSAQLGIHQARPAYLARLASIDYARRAG